MSSTTRRWRIMRWSRLVVTRFLSAYSADSSACMSALMGYALAGMMANASDQVLTPPVFF